MAGLEGSSKLEFISAGDNELEDISALADASKLRTLYLWENELDSTGLVAIFGGVDAPTDLVTLNLDNNSVDSLASMSVLSSLSSLSVYNNRLETLVGLESLSALSYVNVDRNRISDLTPIVNNADFASNDTLVVWSNEFTCAVTDSQVATLTGRGVSVEGYDCD